MKHEAWLFLWFFVGMGLYMLKRAYFLVTGPNPVAPDYATFFKKYWIPLLVRGGIDSAVFWLCFTPALLEKGLGLLGWDSFAGVVGLVTQYAPVALIFGHFIDSLADIAIAKVPGLKDALPQIP